MQVILLTYLLANFKSRVDITKEEYTKQYVHKTYRIRVEYLQ